MQFSVVGHRVDLFAIAAKGPIISGDFDRFVSVLRTLPKSATRVVLALDSPGGNVVEAERIAEAMRKAEIFSLVEEHSSCASACFLLFAAGFRKYVEPAALVGVHSASESGEESVNSLAATAAMARDAATLGVPSAIVGKMVATPPGRVAWLLPAELRAMGVTSLPPPQKTGAAPGDPPPQNAAVTAPGPPIAPKPLPQTAPPKPLPPAAVPTQGSVAFEAGRTDRQVWETWFAAQVGEMHEGAAYWAATRTAPRPDGCHVAEWQGRPDLITGCLAAQRLLGPSDIRRHREPDYRSGWNSM